MELPLVDPRDPNYEVGPGVGGNKTIKLNTLLPDIYIYMFISKFTVINLKVFRSSFTIMQITILLLEVCI